jgi:hypothetical protein
MNECNLTDRELHTLLAALRYYEAGGQCRKDQRCGWIDELASNGGEVEPLTEAELDQLCQRLNFGDDAT